MLSQTLREPDEDIEAQIAALCDPTHSKDAMFLAPSNDVPVTLSPDVRVVCRADGTLLTTDEAKAKRFFESLELSERDMAEILGYPEAKSDVMAAGAGVIVQARNSRGAIVMEAAASFPRLGETVAAVTKQIPLGGAIAVISPLEALSRRASLAGG